MTLQKLASNTEMINTLLVTVMTNTLLVGNQKVYIMRRINHLILVLLKK